MTAAVTTRGVIRSTLALSAGTVVTRVLSALGQVVLAVWLSPTQFGYWASAMAAMSILAGIANFGEVNAYLASPAASLSRLRADTRRLNVWLVLASTPIIAAYAVTGHTEVAVLAAVVALSIPIQGEADVLYAAYVRHNRRRRLVWAMVFAAVWKTALGVVLAWLFHSPLALAASYLAFPVVQYLLLRPRQAGWGDSTDPADPMGRRARTAWALNSLSQTVPLQVGYFVTQFVASPAVLGIYFLAYQVTIGITGFVAVPLARSTLAGLSTAPTGDRMRIVTRMASAVTGATALCVCVLALFLSELSGRVHGTWHDAVPTTIILLASLPVRMLSPMLDAFQQASGRLWQSTTFNVIDAVGTAVAALAGLTGNVAVLAVAATAWKAAFGIGRMLYVLRAAPFGVRARLFLSLTAVTCALCLATFPSLPQRPLWYSLAALVAIASMLGDFWRTTWTPHPATRPTVKMLVLPVGAAGLLIVVMLALTGARAAALLLAAVVLVPAMLHPGGRLLVFLVGGMLVFQSASVGAGPKTAYIGVTLVGALMALSSLAPRWQFLGTRSARAFRRGLGGLGLVCVVGMLIGTAGGASPTASLRDATPYVLLAVAPLYGLDAARRLTTRQLEIAILVVGFAGAASYLLTWLARRHETDASQFALSSSMLVIPAICLCLAKFYSRVRGATLYLLAAVAMSAMILMSGGRSAVFYLILIFLGVMLCNGQSLGRRMQRSAILVVLSALGVSVMLSVSRAITGTDFLAHRLSFFEDLSLSSISSDSSGMIRLRAYSIVEQVFSQHPFVGAGFGFSYLSPANELPMANNFTLDTPLLYLSKFGLLGVGVLVVCLLSLFRAVWFLPFKSDYDLTVMHMVLVGVGAAWLGLLVSGAPTEQKGCGLAVALVVGLGASGMRDWLRRSGDDKLNTGAARDKLTATVSDQLVGSGARR